MYVGDFPGWWVTVLSNKSTDDLNNEHTVQSVTGINVIQQDMDMEQM